MTGILVALLSLAKQHATPPVDSARIAREAVTQFYAWYVPAAAKRPVAARANAGVRSHNEHWIRRAI